MTKKQIIRINDIKIGYAGSRTDHDSEALQTAGRLVFRKTGIRPGNLRIAKKSIDARRVNGKRNITFVYSVSAEVEGLPDGFSDPGIKVCADAELKFTMGSARIEQRPVIVGFGPAGMFCAYVLAKYGYEPLVLERGDAIGDRIRKVDRFVKDGILDEQSNVQFGAGGAGTFSDGKLNTRINDPLAGFVLQTLRTFGAPEDILYKAKPHVGTDVLRNVVMNADREITRLGGEIRYRTCVTHVGNRSVKCGGSEIPYMALVLAVGHSARDTYGDLMGSGFVIEPKPFSVGVRIEHLQEDIDKSMFGDFAGDRELGHAEYQLSMRKGNRGCYSFCMCPGGVVMPSSSENGEIVTNGMSFRARDGKNANAALCVSVHPDDYGDTPEGAIGFQKRLERAAFTAGGGGFKAPVQTVGDFMRTGNSPPYSGFTKIMPTYRDGSVEISDLTKLMPDFVTEMLREGIADFGRKIRGFDDPAAPLTGFETRTSSPVRILRNGDCKAVGKTGVYPCGEGAGYAGGIVSAAVDGIRVAMKIMEEYSPVRV
ncbi:MAG: NAD(P)-binding protein [Clostridia bacterium]|nr:NAD(P)-binding protein [Clostridia bacterium]